MVDCVCVKHKTLYNCLRSSFSSCFSASRIRDFGTVNGIPGFKNLVIWWIEAVSYAFFISIRPMITTFGKQVHLQILTQRRLIKDVITLRSCDKLKALYFHYQSAYGHQTWQDVNLPCWAPAIKSFDPLLTWSFKIT